MDTSKIFNRSNYLLFFVIFDIIVVFIALNRTKFVEYFFETQNTLNNLGIQRTSQHPLIELASLLLAFVIVFSFISFIITAIVIFISCIFKRYNVIDKIYTFLSEKTRTIIEKTNSYVKEPENKINLIFWFSIIFLLTIATFFYSWNNPDFLDNNLTNDPRIKLLSFISFIIIFPYIFIGLVLLSRYIVRKSYGVLCDRVEKFIFIKGYFLEKHVIKTTKNIKKRGNELIYQKNKIKMIKSREFLSWLIKADYALAGTVYVFAQLLNILTRYSPNTRPIVTIADVAFERNIVTHFFGLLTLFIVFYGLLKLIYLKPKMAIYCSGLFEKDTNEGNENRIGSKFNSSLLDGFDRNSQIITICVLLVTLIQLTETLEQIIYNLMNSIILIGLVAFYFLMLQILAFKDYSNFKSKYEEIINDVETILDKAGITKQ